MSVSHSPGSGVAFLSRVSFSSFYLVYLTMPGIVLLGICKESKGGGENVEGRGAAGSETSQAIFVLF